MKIGIVGLGFVGLSFATVLASKGFSVCGIDKNLKIITKIKSGIAPFYEPKLNNLLTRSLKKSLKIFSSIKEIKDCDIIFITVGTPTKKGQIDLTSVRAVAKEIGSVLSNSQKKPIIVVKSTVVPGTTQKVVQTIIEKNSKKMLGRGFELATNPEFLREGKAIEDTLKPHLVVIGSENKQTVNKIKKFYNSLDGTKIPYLLTNPQTAEMIKYANNSFLATKISFINQIANICQSIPDTNVDDIAKAIGTDPRIGNLFLNAGPGFGGSCLPKDLQSLITFSTNLGQNPELLKGVQKINSNQVLKLYNYIKKIKGLKNKKITILGLAFKENSDDIRESVSIKLIKKLLKNNFKITVHDPKAIENTEKIFNGNIKYAKTIPEALNKSECVIIMTAWNQYKSLTNKDFKLMKNKVVIDTRRILNNKKLKINYYALGQGKLFN